MPYKDPERRRATQRTYSARYYASNRERVLAKRRDPRVRALRAVQSRKWRSKHVTDRSPVPSPYRGHPVLDLARELVGEPWYGDRLYDPVLEDALGEAVLAMLEGRDPVVAARAEISRELRWRIRTVPFNGIT
jgi:hypothetical protein